MGAQAGPGIFCGVGQGCQQEPYSRAHSSRIANGGWNYHLAFSAVSPLVDSLVVSWNFKADAETAASNNEAGPAWTMMPTTSMARPSASKLTSWECQSMHRAAMPLKSSCELTKGVLHVRETRTRGTRARSGVRLQKESKLQLAPAGSAGGKLTSRARQLPHC